MTTNHDHLREVAEANVHIRMNMWLDPQEILAVLDELNHWRSQCEAEAIVSSSYFDELAALRKENEELRTHVGSLVKAGSYLINRVVETKGIRCMDDMSHAIDAARAAIGDSHE